MKAAEMKKIKRSLIALQEILDVVDLGDNGWVDDNQLGDLVRSLDKNDEVPDVHELDDLVKTLTKEGGE